MQAGRGLVGSPARDVRPSAAIEGLDVHLDISTFGQVHALVVGEVLERLFKGGTLPTGWMSAYRENAALIESVIVRKHDAAPGRPIIVTMDDFCGS